MAQDSKDLNLNLHEWQRKLLEELLEKSKSGSLPHVFHHRWCSGKSWIQRWLNENWQHYERLNGRNYVPPPLTTKADISTLVLKSRPNISVAKKQEPFIIYCDEMNYPVNDELYEKLKQITDKIKKSVASTPKSEYNIYLS